MGYIRHDAIIVTAWDMKHVEPARAKAIDLDLQCTEVAESRTNGYVHFMIIPDGSKEGWETSNAGNLARAEWIKWVRATDNLYIDWVHVTYGGDNSETVIIEDHNDKGVEL